MVVVWVLGLAGAVGMPLITAVALYRSGSAAGLSRRTSVAVAVGAGVLWGGWVGTSAALAAAGVYQDPNSVVPWLGVAAAGALLAALLATRIPVVARILVAPGTVNRLAWPQMLRVVGAVFLIAMAPDLGQLPAVFALPGGLGDIAIGVTAMLLVRNWRPGRAVWFNVLGILDLVVVLIIGLVSGDSMQAATLLPLALIPTSTVPLDLALHLVSLARLRTATRLAAAPAPG